MHFQQVRLPIDMVVQRVQSGRLALPEFQRDFVWAPSQISELLDTVARQWPMGSLLLLSGTNIFAAREIESAPKLSSNGPDTYILDGQQRVTSLYHAVTDVSKYCYYVDFNQLADDNGEIVKWMPRRIFEKSFGEIHVRAKQGVALIKDIWEASNFFGWLSFVGDVALCGRYMRLRDEKLSGFHSNVYQVMAIGLEEGIGLEALSRIFETINRTGVALNAFDLMVAKLYPTGFKLREKWEEALRRKPTLRHFNPSELELLKLISLLIRDKKGSRGSKGVRQGDILSLSQDDVMSFWDEAVELYSDALDLAVTYGVVCSELVPSWSMILGLVGCQKWLTSDETYIWWKSSILQQIFAQSANTKIVAEFDGKMRVSDLSVDEGLTPEELLAKSVRANGLLSKGFASLLIKNNARDPITGRLLLESSTVLFKTLGDDDVLYNVRANDLLRNMVLVSGENNKFNMNGVVSGNPHWKSGLMSQGINPVIGERSVEFIYKIF